MFSSKILILSGIKFRFSIHFEFIIVYGLYRCGSAGKESAYNMGDLGSMSGLGRSPGEGNSYQLQYSGLENIEESLYPWEKSQSIMMYDLLNMLLDSVC